MAVNDQQLLAANQRVLAAVQRRIGALRMEIAMIDDCLHASQPCISSASAVVLPARHYRTDCMSVLGCSAPLNADARRVGDIQRMFPSPYSRLRWRPRMDTVLLAAVDMLVTSADHKRAIVSDWMDDDMIIRSDSGGDPVFDVDAWGKVAERVNVAICKGKAAGLVTGGGLAGATAWCCVLRYRHLQRSVRSWTPQDDAVLMSHQQRLLTAGRTFDCMELRQIRQLLPGSPRPLYDIAARLQFLRMASSAVTLRTQVGRSPLDVITKRNALRFLLTSTANPAAAAHRYLEMTTTQQGSGASQEARRACPALSYRSVHRNARHMLSQRQHDEDQKASQLSAASQLSPGEWLHLAIAISLFGNDFLAIADWVMPDRPSGRHTAESLQGKWYFRASLQMRRKAMAATKRARSASKPRRGDEKGDKGRGSSLRKDDDDEDAAHMLL